MKRGGRAKWGWPMPVWARDRLAVKCLVTPQDAELYATLLPSPLRMPAAPTLLVELVRFGPRWHEAGLSMACSYDGQEGWHGLYWAIDSRVPHRLGRLIGYPKVMVDHMRVDEVHGGAEAEVTDGGRTLVRLDFRADASSEGADEVRDPADERPYFMLVPPGEGPRLLHVTFRETHAPSTTACTGAAEIRFDVDAPWRGLLPDPGVVAPARSFVQKGRGLGFLLASPA